MYTRGNPIRYNDPTGNTEEEEKDDVYPWDWDIGCILGFGCGGGGGGDSSSGGSGDGDSGSSSDGSGSNTSDSSGSNTTYNGYEGYYTGESGYMDGMYYDNTFIVTGDDLIITPPESDTISGVNAFGDSNLPFGGSAPMSTGSFTGRGGGTGGSRAASNQSNNTATFWGSMANTISNNPGIAIGVGVGIVAIGVGIAMWPVLVPYLAVMGPAIGTIARRGARAVQEVHHMLPRQFNSFFRSRGLNINQHTTRLSKDAHRLKPGGIHTGPDNWNKVWQRWINQNRRTATMEDILQQLEKMRQDFGI